MSAPPSLCSHLSGSLRMTEKTNSIKATKESLCCPSKRIVAFKHCLLIKSQQKRITWCSACNKSHRTTPIKAPIHMKAISRQQQLFKSSPPCQSLFAPQQDCGSVCVSVSVSSLFATGEASLLLVPATAPPECRLHFSAKALTRLCPPVCLPG